jgi:putative MATE family efflux protein
MKRFMCGCRALLFLKACEVYMNGRARRLAQYVVPMILSSICFFLYTIVDGIFIGHGVGVNGVGAVNMAIPFVMIVNALFMLTSVGGITVTAIRFGRGDISGANQAFMHSFSATMVIAAVLGCAGICFPGQIAHLLGADDTYFSMVHDYVFWYSVFLIPSGAAMIFQSFCRNDGSPVLVSVSVIAATVCNVFGDWLTVFPLGMGVKGAAIATGVSQTVSLIIVAFHFLLKKGQLRIGRFSPSAALFGKVFKRGLPEMVSKFAAPLSTIYLNYVLLRNFGASAVNAFSLLSYVASFSVAVFFGTAEGLQPLYGQSYGAKDSESLHYYFHAGLVINVAASIIIFVLLFFVGRPVCALFNADEATLDLTMQEMPKYALSFCAIAVTTVVSSYFYSTKRTKESLILNIVRSFVANTFAIVLLPLLFGKCIIWYTYFIAELIPALLAAVQYVVSERKGIVWK